MNIFLNHACLVKRYDDALHPLPLLQMIQQDSHRHFIEICMGRQSEITSTSETAARQRLWCLGFDPLFPEHDCGNSPAIHAITSTIMQLARAA